MFPETTEVGLTEMAVVVGAPDTVNVAVPDEPAKLEPDDGV
jgi:hypothetical protein